MKMKRAVGSRQNFLFNLVSCKMDVNTICSSKCLNFLEIYAVDLLLYITIDFCSPRSDGTGTSRQGQVLAIGATNRPHELDDAARRRFVKRLYIPLPERPDREILLRTLLTKNSHNLTDRDFTKLSTDAKGFSGADLKALCTDAALGPIRQLGVRALEVNALDVPPISYRHFRHALKGMRPSVAKSDLDIYIEWNMTYGSKSVSAEDYAMSEEESDCSSGD